VSGYLIVRRRVWHGFLEILRTAVLIGGFETSGAIRDRIEYDSSVGSRVFKQLLSGAPKSGLKVRVQSVRLMSRSKR
jgi:hypothetical protein